MNMNICRVGSGIARQIAMWIPRGGGFRFPVAAWAFLLTGRGDDRGQRRKRIQHAESGRCLGIGRHRGVCVSLIGSHGAETGQRPSVPLAMIGKTSDSFSCGGARAWRARF